jgi:hypothetical protein
MLLLPLPRYLLLASTLLLAAGLIAPLPASAVSRTYHVSPTGSDSASGSAKHPWRTLRHSLAALHAGDTLYVHGGSYVERVQGKGSYLRVAAGTPRQRITVRNAPGERPVLRGLLWLADPDYWTIRGLDVTWGSDNPEGTFMVRVKNGRGWVINRAEIWGGRGYANVNVTSSRDGVPANWRISRSCIHDNVGLPSHGKAKDQLLYVNTGVRAGRGVIARNLLFNSPRGKGIKLAGPSTGTGSTSVTVRHNTIYNTARPAIVVGMDTRDTVIRRNLLVRTNDSGLIRGFRLDGADNVAFDNGWDQGPRAIDNDAGSAAGVANLGGNRHVDARFDRIGCGGFHPKAPVAARYGRYAR